MIWEYHYFWKHPYILSTNQIKPKKDQLPNLGPGKILNYEFHNPIDVNSGDSQKPSTRINRFSSH